MGVLALLLFGLLTTETLATSSEEEVVLHHKHKSRISPHPHNEWIQGPDNYLYQFHIGQQNWLLGREYCLTQNSDLVSIRSDWQKEWILAHYSHLGHPFAERTIQIGLSASDGIMKVWKWVDNRDLNGTVSWVNGAPFDHSVEGRERCALMRISDGRIDDVDCEQSVDGDQFNRFICERSQDRHQLQQRSNNFIWEKIEHFLEFLGLKPVDSQKPLDQIGASHNFTVDYPDEAETTKQMSNSEKFELASIKLDDTTDDPKEEEAEVDGALAQLSVVDSILPQNPKRTTQKSSDAESTIKPIVEPPTNDQTDNSTSKATMTEITVEGEKKKNALEEADVGPIERGGYASGENATEKARGLGTHLASESVPLKELEVEGSGASSDIEKEILNTKLETLLSRPDGAEKLENMILEMEKAIVAIEKNQTDLLPKTDINDLVTEVAPIQGRTTQKTRESGEKFSVTSPPTERAVSSNQEKIELTSTISSNIVTADILEADFEQTTIDMPVAEFSPDDDCEEEAEGSGDDSSTTAPISLEKEKKLDEFLTTLRQFLDRANRTDISSVLKDTDQSKSLLQRMKEAIKKANDLEFEKLNKISDLKHKGEDTAKIEGETHENALEVEEKEVLFNKISEVMKNVVKEETDKQVSTAPEIAPLTPDVANNATESDKEAAIVKSNTVVMGDDQKKEKKEVEESKVDAVESPIKDSDEKSSTPKAEEETTAVSTSAAPNIEDSDKTDTHTTELEGIQKATSDSAVTSTTVSSSTKVTETVTLNKFQQNHYNQLEKKNFVKAEAYKRNILSRKHWNQELLKEKKKLTQKAKVDAKNVLKPKRNTMKKQSKQEEEKELKKIREMIDYSGEEEEEKKTRKGVKTKKPKEEEKKKKKVTQKPHGIPKEEEEEKKPSSTAQTDKQDEAKKMKKEEEAKETTTAIPTTTTTTGPTGPTENPLDPTNEVVKSEESSEENEAIIEKKLAEAKEAARLRRLKAKNGKNVADTTTSSTTESTTTATTEGSTQPATTDSTTTSSGTTNTEKSDKERSTPTAAEIEREKLLAKRKAKRARLAEMKHKKFSKTKTDQSPLDKSEESDEEETNTSVEEESTTSSSPSTSTASATSAVKKDEKKKGKNNKKPVKIRKSEDVENPQDAVPIQKDKVGDNSQFPELEGFEDDDEEKEEDSLETNDDDKPRKLSPEQKKAVRALRAARSHKQQKPMMLSTDEEKKDFEKRMDITGVVQEIAKKNDDGVVDPKNPLMVQPAPPTIPTLNPIVALDKVFENLGSQFKKFWSPKLV